MRTIETFLSQPFFRALGWTLIHFIWQGALLGLLYAGASVLLRRAAANVRYLAACSVLLLMLILPAATFYLISSAATNAPDSQQRELSSVKAPATIEPINSLPHKQVSYPGQFDSAELLPPEAIPTQGSAEDSFAALLPWLVLIWMMGALILSVRFFGGWTAAQRLKTLRVRTAARDWQGTVKRLAGRLRVLKPVRLGESPLVEVPTVIGWLRPIILVPVSVLTGLTSEQVEALLAHELAHIRRHDYLVNLLQTALEALLFYHPAVWWVSKQARLEREHCCDDLAVEACGDVLTYARALTTLEHLRSGLDREQFALAANGGPPP